MSEVSDMIKKEIDSSDLMKKEDMDSMLESTRDLTIRQVLDHENCGKDGCGVCGMKDNIDQSSYKRGVVSGIKLKTKFPTAKFNLD